MTWCKIKIFHYLHNIDGHRVKVSFVSSQVQEVLDLLDRILLSTWRIVDDSTPNSATDELVVPHQGR